MKLTEISCFKNFFVTKFSITDSYNRATWITTTSFGASHQKPGIFPLLPLAGLHCIALSLRSSCIFPLSAKWNNLLLREISSSTARVKTQDEATRSIRGKEYYIYARYVLRYPKLNARGRTQLRKQTYRHARAHALCESREMNKASVKTSERRECSRTRLVSLCVRAKNERSEKKRRDKGKGGMDRPLCAWKVSRFHASEASGKWGRLNATPKTGYLVILRRLFSGVEKCISPRVRASERKRPTPTPLYPPVLYDSTRRFHAALRPENPPVLASVP